jgi:hypothetical protein
MRHFNNLPRDDGSRWSPQEDGSHRSPQYPPSHPLMALPSHPAQAPAQKAQPSGPSTHTTLMGRVSPLLHQPRSTTYSPPTSVTMGGEYGPMAAPPMPSAQVSPPDHLAKGSMAPLHATTEAATPSPSSARPFLPTWSSPTHPLLTMGGSAALAAHRALERSQQCLALAMSKYPGFADEHPWVMKNINAVALELQCWYRRHSIRRYLARQTWQCLAATTIQCWKRCIWLDRWFIQQALQRQKRLPLQLLCRGALAYAMSVRGDCRHHLPPRPTKPPTQRSSVIPSRIVVCHYHEGGGLDKTIILDVARVEGIGPVLPILEGGHCACLFVFGLHSLLWQHRNYALAPGGHCFHPTSHPTQLPQLFNACTAPTLIRLIRSGNGG